MNRFQKKNRYFYLPSFLLPVLLFITILAVFLLGLSSVSKTASSEEKKQLEASIRQDAVQCYALEGFYPDSLAYLEEHYAVHYNKKKYIVSYEIIGSNMMPDIQVISKKTPQKETGGLP